MCRSLLMRATEVEIDLVGDPHSVVRRAQRGGLIWSLVAVEGDRACLRLSGPLRLFRRTTRYGHALGQLLPELADCRQFDLCATLVFGDREVELRLRSSDPFLPPGSATRLARRTRFRRLLEGGEWTVRDAQPIEAGARLLFPDIELTRPGDPDRRWLLERVGFWTPQYLEEKCADYASAGVVRLILCVDERMRCGEGDAPSGIAIVWHRGSVSPEAIWQVVSSEQ
jgi:predicted nuclease of restriction endonuclease-like RecB superfamily